MFSGFRWLVTRIGVIITYAYVIELKLLTREATRQLEPIQKVKRFWKDYCRYRLSERVNSFKTNASASSELHGYIIRVVSKLTFIELYNVTILNNLNNCQCRRKFVNIKLRRFKHYITFITNSKIIVLDSSYLSILSFTFSRCRSFYFSIINHNKLS